VDDRLKTKPKAVTLIAQGAFGSYHGTTVLSIATKPQLCENDSMEITFRASQEASRGASGFGGKP
jgi:hypothetical protein